MRQLTSSSTNLVTGTAAAAVAVAAAGGGNGHGHKDHEKADGDGTHGWCYTKRKKDAEEGGLEGGNPQQPTHTQRWASGPGASTYQVARLASSSLGEQVSVNNSESRPASQKPECGKKIVRRAQLQKIFCLRYDSQGLRRHHVIASPWHSFSPQIIRLSLSFIKRTGGERKKKVVKNVISRPCGWHRRRKLARAKKLQSENCIDTTCTQTKL